MSEELTQLLAASNDDEGSRSKLLEAVYGQLRKIAQNRMNSERGDHTLEATALVHEAYLRLVGDAPVPWANRAHFFHAAGEAMRRILVEHARAKKTAKRGGGQPRRQMPLNVLELAAGADLDEILSVDEAVRRLEEQDPDLAKVVRLRFYAGLSEEEVASALGVSDRTVRRDWTLARAWLRTAIAGNSPSDESADA